MKQLFKLGHIVSFRTGKLNSNAAVENGEYPFFTCSQETYRTNTFSFDTECVLLAGNNANGIYPLKYFRGKFDAYQRTYVIEPLNKDEVNVRYLYYALKLKLTYLRQLSTGAATKFLTLSILRDIELYVPHIEEQRRIVKILSVYDDLIENNNRRMVILEESVRHIFEEWFVNFRLPGHENMSMVTSELGRIPKGWQVLKLEEVCSRITDGSHTSPKSVDTGLPMASVKDMRDWGINISSCRQISKDDYLNLVRNDCKPKLGDILIAKDGSYLKHTFVVDEEVDLVILSSIAILRPNGKFFANQLALYLQLPEIKNRMKGYVSGVAIPRIVLRDFRQFLVLVPPKALQEEWSEKCDALLSLCRNLVRKNSNLGTTRDLLVPRLISGELDVSKLPTLDEVVA